MHDSILVTGGAGFIGSNFVHSWIGTEQGLVANLDKLTYAGSLSNLRSLERNRRHVFLWGDILNRECLRSVLQKFRPRSVFHFAAETHVDRSICTPQKLVETNVTGTMTLLEEVKDYWLSLSNAERSRFRLIHVSTDEVYGSLGPNDQPFSESSAYAPSSPYAASKAAADHLVYAYFRTYGLPAIITNCTNNYGPHQFPEKLIPLAILNAYHGRAIPVYGDGLHIRDWLHVEDHCAALRAILKSGIPGEKYNIGANHEISNLDLIRSIVAILDELMPSGSPHESLI